MKSWQKNLVETEDGKLIYRVDKAAESGIIKEENKTPITQITERAIENVPLVSIQGYSADQCVFVQHQHKELLKYARDSNDGNEVAFVFRKDFSGKSVFLESDGGFRSAYGRTPTPLRTACSMICW